MTRVIENRYEPTDLRLYHAADDLIELLETRYQAATDYLSENQP